MLYDKDVEKVIGFWQKERDCLILITGSVMDILYLKTGEVDRGICLDTDDDNKYILIKSIRRYFKSK